MNPHDLHSGCPKVMSECFVNILLIIAFFCWVFHVTLNGCNALLKNDGDCWKSVDAQIVLPINIMAMCKKSTSFRVKLI